MIYYATYKGLYFPKDEDYCEPGKFPLDEMMVYIEIGAFYLYIISIPVFLALSSLIGFRPIAIETIHIKSKNSIQME